MMMSSEDEIIQHDDVLEAAPVSSLKKTSDSTPERCVVVKKYTSPHPIHQPQTVKLRTLFLRKHVRPNRHHALR
jgi:acyl-coenzyme A synthetase/AMP-(fatty) acid ligase